MVVVELATDAMAWAKAFRATVEHEGLDPLDPGVLVGWFANAIEAGVAGRRRTIDEDFVWLSDGDGDDMAIRRGAVIAVLLHNVDSSYVVLGARIRSWCGGPSSRSSAASTAAGRYLGLQIGEHGVDVERFELAGAQRERGDRRRFEGGAIVERDVELDRGPRQTHPLHRHRRRVIEPGDDELDLLDLGGVAGTGGVDHATSPTAMSDARSELASAIVVAGSVAAAGVPEGRTMGVAA